MNRIVRVEEGDREVMTPDEYGEGGGRSWPMISLMASKNHMLKTGKLVEKSRHNKHVIERALEEDDVFHGEISVPGWFINDDDDWQEEVGNQHPGATVEVEGLIEDYSEKAWRVIAKETSSRDHVYNWFWCFAPKSVVTVLTVDSPEDEEAMWDLDEQISEAERRAQARDEDDLEDKSWQELLADVDSDFDPDEFEDEAFEQSDAFETIGREEPEFEAGDQVKVTAGTRKGQAGTIEHVVPNHNWDDDDWTYHVHFSSDPCDWIPLGPDALENPLTAGADDSDPFRNEDGELDVDVLEEYIQFIYGMEVSGYWVVGMPTTNDDGEFTNIEELDTEPDPDADGDTRCPAGD